MNSNTHYLFVITATLAALVIGSIIRGKSSSIARVLVIAILCFELVLQALTTQYPSVFRISLPFELGNFTLIYLYILSITERPFNISKVNKLNLLPFLTGWVWFFFIRTDDALVDKYFHNAIQLVVLIPYLYFSIRQVRKFNELASENLSDLSSLHLSWLRFLIGVCIGSGLLSLTDLLTGPFYPLWIYSPLFGTAGLLGLVYYSLRATQFWKIEEESFSPKKPNPSQLSDKEIERITTLITAALVDKKLYLSPTLRLSDLADVVGVKSYVLSEVINRGLKTNFFELVNRYRLDHSRKLFTDPAAQHMNLLGIAMDSGFNSKSTFNDTFRKKFGVTPSEYRSKASSKSDLTNSDVRTS